MLWDKIAIDVSLLHATSVRLELPKTYQVGMDASTRAIGIIPEDHHPRELSG